MLFTHLAGSVQTKNKLPVGFAKFILGHFIGVLMKIKTDQGAPLFEFTALIRYNVGA